MPPDNNQTDQRSVHEVPETAMKAQIGQPAGYIPKKGYPIFGFALLALHQGSHQCCLRRALHTSQFMIP
jgi:hypothetical protein